MESLVKDRSFSFAVRVVRSCQKLIKDQQEFILTRQLMKSGTAIGALIREAQNAESSRDFIHKLGIAQKECDETVYWLDLLVASGYLTIEYCTPLRIEAMELLKMIRSAILTMKRKHNL